MILLTRRAAVKNRCRSRFFGSLGQVDICMNPTTHSTLPDLVRDLLGGPHLSVLATTNPDGRPQTSVIFVMHEGDDILFSTIKGRRKTANMARDPRVNLLVHRLPIDDTYPPYAAISATVDLIDDPDGSFHQVMYDIHMGGATPPPEPRAKRLIVRMRLDTVYVPPRL